MTAPACLVASLFRARSPDILFLQSAVSDINLSSYTFAGQNLGPASPDRYILFGVALRDEAGGAAETVSTATIAGVAATKIVEIAPTGRVSASLFIAFVPTGTSADVVINATNGCSGAGVSLLRITNLSNTTAFDTATSAAANPASLTLDVPAGGFAVAVDLIYSNANGSATAAWTGLSENSDLILEPVSNDGVFTFASGMFGGGASALVVTCSHSGGDTEHALCAASFGN